MPRIWDPYRCDHLHFPIYWQVVGSEYRVLHHDFEEPRAGRQWMRLPTTEDGAELPALVDGIYCEACVEFATENGAVPVAESEDRARALFKKLVDERPSRNAPSDIPSLVSYIAKLPNVVSHEHVDMVPRTSGPLPADFTGPLYDALRRRYENGFYPHQVEALNAARLGKDVVQMTPTSSGKTIGLLYPAVEAALVGQKSIVVAPRKVLAPQYINELATTCDEFEEVAPRVFKLTFGASTVTIGCFDGDTPSDSHETICAQADIVITNEHMAKEHFLDPHSKLFKKWQSFLCHVKFVVIDELDCHSGHEQTKLEPVQRALIEIVAYASSKRPQVLAASATTAKPTEWHRRVTGGTSSPEIIDASCGQSERDVFVVSPADGQSPLEQAAALLTELTLANDGLAPMSLVFSTSPGQVAKVHESIAQSFADAGLASEVSKTRRYTGNTPADERLEIEAAIMRRQARVTVANEALGVGADLGTLEVAIFVGSPLTAGKAKQYLGRVGRRRRSIVVFVVDDSPLGTSLRGGPSPLAVLDEIAGKALVPIIAEHFDAHCLRPLFACLGEIPRDLVDSLPNELLSDLTDRLGLYRKTGRKLTPQNESPRAESLFDDPTQYTALVPHIGRVPLGVADGRRSNVTGAELTIGDRWYRVVHGRNEGRNGKRRLLEVEAISEPSGWYAAPRYETDDITLVKEFSVGGTKMEFGCGNVTLAFNVTNPSGPRRKPPAVSFSDASTVQFFTNSARLPTELVNELRTVAFELAIPHVDLQFEVLDDGSVLMFDLNRMGRMAWFVAEEFLQRVAPPKPVRKAA